MSMKHMTKKALAIALGFLISSFVQPISHATLSPAPEWNIKKREWRKATAGYLLETSNVKGSNVKVFVSCPAKSFHLLVGKIGNYPGSDFKKVFQTPTQECNNQSEIKSENWISNTSLDTNKYEGGMYLIKIIDSEGFKSYIPMVIKDINRKSRAVFVVPTMTMFAYNSWSGSNTYEGKKGFNDRLRIVDFRSPFDSGFGTGKYWKYVHPLVVELERLNIEMDYVTDVDLHYSPELLENRTLLVSAGHDEYWTPYERENVINARKAGMNLLFFGANAGYWQTRLRKGTKSPSIVMEIYKSREEDPKKNKPTIRFRDGGFSESELTGAQYTCFPAVGRFEFFDKSFFGFEGLSSKNFASLNKIVGPEVDEVPLVNKFSGSVHVVAEGKVKCGNRWLFPKIGRVNMVYGTATNGGGVFSVGTMGWVLKGLGSGAEKSVRETVVRITRNVVLRGIQGPFTR